MVWKARRHASIFALHLTEYDVLQIPTIMSIKGRAYPQLQRNYRALRSLEATIRLGGNCYAVYDLGMIWKVYDDVESLLGISEVSET